MQINKKKRAQDQGKESEIQETESSKSCTIPAEDLAQTHAGLVLDISVSVSPYVFCVVDSVGHALLVSSVSLDSYNLSYPCAVVFPELIEEGLDGDL